MNVREKTETGLPEHGLLALLVMIGGAVGALTRYRLNTAITAVHCEFLSASSTFPVGILSINTLGGLLMGLLTGAVLRLMQREKAASAHHIACLQAFLATGVLGGFTTFSTFSLDTVHLYLNNGALPALSNIAANLVLSTGAAALGLRLAAPSQHLPQNE